MALSTQPYKGARDFYPEDKRLQNYIFNKLRTVVESFGYEEYDAPILESLDLYLAKTGEEIVNEQSYAFTDRGGRPVAIRPEMTPSVSRMVAAKRQELPYPLRWYSIPNLWRYERPQRGRLREHWQLNVDIFGVPTADAERELVLVMDRILKSFGASSSMYEIRLNSRALVDYMLGEYLGFNPAQTQAASKLIDRMHKMDTAAFRAQLDALCTPEQQAAGLSDHLLGVLQCKKLDALPVQLRTQPVILELQTMLETLASLGVTNARFDPTLMRGFDYYTGLVFEVFDTHPDDNRSMFGGGRYDGLVGLFGVDAVATAGFGMGDVTLAGFLEAHGLLPKVYTETDVYVVLIGDGIAARAEKVFAELRAAGVRLAVDYSNRKVGQQIKTAEKKQVPFVLVLGQEELDNFNYPLKNLQTGVEEKHGISKIVNLVSEHRASRGQ